MTSLTFLALIPFPYPVPNRSIAYPQVVDSPNFLQQVGERFTVFSLGFDDQHKRKKNTNPEVRFVDAVDPLYDPPDAAAYLGVKENTLAVWRCAGRYGIEYVKVGRLVRYRKSALDAFLERRTRSQGGEI